MKNLLSRNHNASCYINIIMKTVAQLEYPHSGNQNFENMFVDHGLLNLQPEPLDPEKIMAEMKSLEKSRQSSSDKENQYYQILDIFHAYEFSSETLGLFIDNYDCLVKHKETVVKNDMRIAKFVVTNDISIGSILSENLLVDSLNDAKGNTTQEKLQILLSKIIGCKLPNPETFNEEDVAVKLTSTITSVDIANDNKFIKFAEQVKTQEGK